MRLRRSHQICQSRADYTGFFQAASGFMQAAAGHPHPMDMHLGQRGRKNVVVPEAILKVVRHFIKICANQ
jgi:hypothetical protein